MRVIAGSAKGRKLVTRDSMETRPTTDRLKESLFAMIQFEVPGARFLDLFAGSGGIGIEALSRGAASAVFVEGSPVAAGCVRKNIQTAGFADRAELLRVDVFQAIRLLKERKERFDILFMDPPYEKGYEQRVLDALMQNDILSPEGLIVVESSSQTPIVPPERLEVEKIKEYKVTKFTFLRGI